MRTRTYACIALVVLALVSVHCDPGSPDRDANLRAYTDLAEEFHTSVSSPGPLTVSIQDQASLDRAIRELKDHEKKISALAEDFKKLPIPDDEAKRAVNKAMEEREKLLQDQIGEKFKERLTSMPTELQSRWNEAMSAFYQNLDRHKDVFAAYFAESENTD